MDRDFWISLTVWILLPLLVIIADVAFNWNILALILGLTWIGFGFFFVLPSNSE